MTNSRVPNEIADLAKFLFSPKGTYTSGNDILIDDGVTASIKYPKVP